MTKRMSVILFLVLGVIIFLLAGFCLVLFLAPGLSVFGLKFIRNDLHAYIVQKTSINNSLAFEKLDDVYKGNLTVQTSEVPITIYYTQGHEYFYEYYDNYNGFTRSNFDDPLLAVYQENGEAVIRTREFKKFIYESSTSERYLKIYIPLLFTSADVAYTKNLTVITDSADITIVYEDREQNQDIRVPAHKNLKIKTKTGKVKFTNTNVRATNLTLETNNSIKFECDENRGFYATNYTAISKNGNVTFLGDVKGDVKAITKNGNISLISCKNLIANTTFGDVGSALKDAPVNIRGIVNITTKAGSVTLGSIKGNGENLITTGGGMVTIDTIKDATITTTRGSVKIRSVNNASISTDIGKVTVEESLSSINVSTKRGNVVLGGATSFINNPTVFSRLGKVTLNTASGVVNLETVSSEINFTNNNSSDIKITSGGKLTATKLTGKVSIHSLKDVDLSFSKITDKVAIELADSCKLAKISAISNSTKDTRFYFKGKYVYRYEDNSKVADATEITHNDEVIYNGPAYIKVEGKNAIIHAYFKLP